jgi:cyclopropane fatty-acyl-phospholipid synthase-like methyltransferase
VAGSMNMDRAYFERVYKDCADPWGFESSWYERRKYDLTLAALPKERYARAFEPGCSIGVLSERLAARCDELVAMELMPSVADVARARVRAHPHASVVRGAVPESWPAGEFDLIVLSEIAYYLTPEGLEAVLERIRASLQPGGTLISVHYLLETDYPLSGRQVGGRLRSETSLREVCSYAEPSFELLVFES